MLKNHITAKKVFKDPHILAMAKAILKFDIDALNSLINEAPDINAYGTNKLTILHWAAYMKNTSAMKALVAAGADVTLHDDDNETAMQLLVGAKDPQYLQEMLNAGIDPNLRNGAGEPLLFSALMYHNLEHLKLLIEHGADVNIRFPANDGKTAISTASSINQYAGLLVLLENGADPHIKDKSGDGFIEFFKFWNEDILTKEALEQRNAVKQWLTRHNIDFE